MSLSEVIGHSQAKKILGNALAGDRVAHAYLFHGPAGVGKTTLARAFAKSLLCGAGNREACGVCPVCEKFSRGQLPDFHVISPAGNNIKIEQVRELQKKALFKPYEAPQKVFLLEQAETMTVEAANCLLKILEDPPPKTILLLTAVNIHNLLPTIISRCLSVQLMKVGAGLIEQMLVSRKLAGPEDAPVLAALADGLPGMAVAMAETGRGTALRDQMFELVEKISRADVSELLKTAEELEKRKDVLTEILEQMLLWYRDGLIWSATGEDRLIINVDKLDVIKGKAAARGTGLLLQNINDILEAKNNISRNVNLRLVLEVMFLKLAGTAGS